MAHFLRGFYRGNLGYQWVYSPAGTLGRFDALALLNGSAANSGILPGEEDGGIEGYSDFDKNAAHLLLSVQWGERVPSQQQTGPRWLRGSNGRFLFAVQGEVYRTNDPDDETDEIWSFAGVTTDPEQIAELLRPDDYTGVLPCTLFTWREFNSGKFTYHPTDSPTGSFTVSYHVNGGDGADLPVVVQPGAVYSPANQNAPVQPDNNDLIAFYFPPEVQSGGKWQPVRCDFTNTDDQGNIIEQFSVYVQCQNGDEREPENETQPTTLADPNLLYGIVAVTALLLAVLALAPLVAAVLAELLAAGGVSVALTEAGEALAAALESPQLLAAMSAVRNLFFNRVGPVAVAAAAAYGGIQSAQQAVTIAVNATAAGDIAAAEGAYQSAAAYVQQVEQQIQRIGR